MPLALSVLHQEETDMPRPFRKNIRIAPANELAENGIRSWRSSDESTGRDRRPGLYSVTGAFIKLSDLPESIDERTKGPRRLA
jgi:hypothetical protein